MTERHRLQQLGACLDPALKEWIDNVIVPGLVQQFVAARHTRPDSIVLDSAPTEVK